MTNLISSKILKKKALDRWENEGGKFSDDQSDEGFLPGWKRRKKSESKTFRSRPTASESDSLPERSRSIN